jgi:two-component system response regulator PilR (NtrC family)
LEDDRVSRILVIDDESSMRQLLEIALGKEGYRITAADSGHKAEELLEKEAFDLIVSDIRMPDMSGVEVLRHVKKVSPETPVIMITAYASTETAVEALRLGAYDYITKPFKIEELKNTIRHALEKTRLKEEVDHLKRELSDRHGVDSMIGNSPKMLELYEHISAVAKTDSTVLITGESGTGKELVARAIHVQSLRQGEPFVSINCGAVPETLLESELFGHLKGSFTGAHTNHKGLFEVAHKGTILLDEIAEMSSSMQVKFLRVLQEKTIRRIGATEEVSVDVRILAATNKNLGKMVEEQAFREDLYYRLNVIPIHLPLLRERRDDIPLLAEYFLVRANSHIGKAIKGISDEAMEHLSAYDWPGNVRELENVIERAVALETTPIVQPERLPDNLKMEKDGIVRFGSMDSFDEFPEEGIHFNEHIADVEKRLLKAALECGGGVQTRAAKLLHMSLRSFRYLIQKYDLR